MKDIVRWYDRENWPYAKDRERLEYYASWLNQIRWLFFCTLTFAWEVSDLQAEGIFKEFVNRLERSLRSSVTYVRGSERRMPGAGFSACPRHFHLLLACTASVAPHFIEELWMSMAGNRSDGAAAKVEPYDTDRKGVQYALKFVNKADGHWDFHNLNLLMPAEGTPSSNHASRRRLRRQKERLQQLPLSRPPVVSAREIDNNTVIGAAE
jgi:hypothetical protein